MSRFIGYIFRSTIIGGSTIAAASFYGFKTKYEEFKTKMQQLKIKSDSFRQYMINKFDRISIWNPNLANKAFVDPKPLEASLIDKNTISNSFDGLTPSNPDESIRNVTKYTDKSYDKELIKQYSEIVEIYSSLNPISNVYDTLPRVIVVGDQSSGKTSVLEFIAKARIFPRGSGEMMTRSPIMVTMFNDTKHVASFKGESNIYDLSNNNDINNLRDQIEQKMISCLEPGETISKIPIHLHMRGPGLPNMILVDLPGIINTVTNDLSPDSKESIISLAQHYMNNPNSIIMCVQDGSIDAERSLVTDLVSQIDKEGNRTICVITKLDMAERNGVKIDRIRRIMSGNLFPLKAINYFAVIAGTGQNNASLDEISLYESNFFKSSTYVQGGAINKDQITSFSMIKAVNDCFWKMVKNSINQELEKIKQDLLGAKAEWNNRFPNIRDFDRTELFEKACKIIVEDSSIFCKISPKEWELSISKILADELIPIIVKDIYFNSALSLSKIDFDTQVEILLHRWLENSLTKTSIRITKDLMIKKLNEYLIKYDSYHESENYKEIFHPLVNELVNECHKHYEWSENNTEELSVIQKRFLLDNIENDFHDWNNACIFFEQILAHNQAEIDDSLSNFIGPSTISSWIKWSKISSDHLANRYIYDQLHHILLHRENLDQKLDPVQISALVQNALTAGYTIETQTIEDIWRLLYMKKFTENSIKGIDLCRNSFHSGNYSKHPFGCNDIMLFNKLHKVLSHTTTTLRYQICSQEAFRLEEFIRKTLLRYSKDRKMIEKLLSGRQVELAVKLKNLRLLKDKMENFIKLLVKNNV